MPAHAPTRERGQRPEHAPRDAEGEVHEPEAESTGSAEPHNYGDEAEEGVLGEVRTSFEEEDSDVITEKTPEPRVIQGQADQRHGCVEQRKGVAIRDEAGNIISVSELWRCQCNAKFMGKTAGGTNELYLAHLRKFDPAVPPPKPARSKR